MMRYDYRGLALIFFTKIKGRGGGRVREGLSEYPCLLMFMEL